MLSCFMVSIRMCYGLLVDEHWLCRERAVDGMVRLVQKRKI